MVRKATTKTVFFATLTAFLVLLDQLIKVAVQNIQPNLSFLFFHISYVENTGAGFGILKGNPLLLGAFSLLTALVIIALYPKFSKENSVQLPLALFLAGTIGNMIDRLFRQYVIDFIGASFWPYFNLADASISISVALFIVFMFFKKDYDIFKEEEQDPKQKQEGTKRKVGKKTRTKK